MSDIAIRVENLGKMYRIGTEERRPANFWQATKQLAASPFDYLRRITRPPTEEETLWALKDVSFEVHRGEVVGVIGRNGAGKSTLLKILSRITEPTTGHAEIHGRVGSLLEVGTGFHPELTGRENIYLNGAILGMKRTEIDRKFDEIVDFAEIEKFLDTPVKRYSSGMYVRLAFAVAAHLEPEILLVDEVLAVGDAAFQKKALGKMGEVTQEGRTVLFVSHNMAAIEQLCSRAILLCDGHVQKSGNISNVVSFYLSAFERRISAADGILAQSVDGSLELISIRLTDEKGQDLSAVQCGRDLHLAILLRTTMPLPRVTVTVGINDLYDTRIATLHSDIAGYHLSLSPGTQCIVCKVPRFPLVPGNYAMDVKVLSGHAVILWAPRVVELSVEAGDFYNTGRLPDLSWGGFCYLHQQWDRHNGR